IIIGFWLGSLLFVFGGILGLAVYAILFLVALFFSYMNLRAREYRFFNDRVEFYEGFLTINRNVVRYDRITDTILRKSVWERIWGVGGIQVMTAGISYGVRISYIRNPEQVYETIQTLIKRYSGKRPQDEQSSPAGRR
ncbi:MAG: PH domain-containing protein, partial [Candidatus Aenigmarchaeota archaeon]|nr:PH domain-containing protein [Candidatus Aenigmarchaeota archaeon]